jgi:hypothetical protein
MLYVENEIKRCELEMRTAIGARYSYLYAIQQALKWAVDPVVPVKRQWDHSGRRPIPLNNRHLRHQSPRVALWPPPTL